MNTFLKKHYYNKEINEVITHTRIKNAELNITGGSYTIIEDKDIFYELYFKDVIKKNGKEYFTEKQNENGVICIDFDFRYDISVKTHQHTFSDIEDYLDILLTIIKSLLKLDDLEFEIFIFEKENVNVCEKEQYTKDGLHIIICIETLNEIK